jgi:hypothetical protein
VTGLSGFSDTVHSVLCLFCCRCLTWLCLHGSAIFVYAGYCMFCVCWVVHVVTDTAGWQESFWGVGRVAGGSFLCAKEGWVHCRGLAGGRCGLPAHSWFADMRKKCAVLLLKATWQQGGWHSRAHAQLLRCYFACTSICGVLKCWLQSHGCSDIV